MNVSTRALLLVLMVLSQCFCTETAEAQQDTDPPAVEAALPDISGVWNSGPDLPGDQIWVRPSKSEGSFEISHNGGAVWLPMHWSAKNKEFAGRSERYGKSTTAFELQLIDDQQSLRLKQRRWLGPGSFVSFEEMVYLRVSKEIPQFTQPKKEKTPAKAVSQVLAQTEPAKEQATTAKATEPTMPDIEGVWEATGTEYKRHTVAKVNRNELMIRRSQDGNSFVLTLDTKVIPLTWSSTGDRFEGVYTGNSKAELKLELSVTSDTTLRAKSEVIHLDGNVPNEISEVQYVRIFKTLPPDITGQWRIVRWGNDAHLLQSIQIESQDSKWTGSYRDWSKTVRGNIELTWSVQSRQFEGTWFEYDHRSGKLAIRLLPDGKTIRGSWTTDAGSKTSDKEPAHSDLEWVRAGADDVTTQAPASTAPKNEAVSEVVTPPDEAAEIKVFTLANGNAADYVNVLRAIFPNVTFQADTRTNQIIAVFKKRESGQLVEALLLRLDETKTPKQPLALKGGRDPLPTRSLQDLTAAIDAQEHRAITLAHRIRQLGAKHPDLEKAREELNVALQAALDLKFQQEQLQLQQLEDRLSRVQKQLELRQAAASKIVERRAHELLEGDLKWNPDSPSPSNPNNLSNRSSETRSTQTSPLQTHTQVEFLEPSEMQFFVEDHRAPLTTPTYYNFERDLKNTRDHKFRLLVEGETPIEGTVSIFPFNPESLLFMGSIKLRLTTVDLKQIQQGENVTIVAFADQGAPQLRLDTLHSTRIDPTVDPVAEAQRRGKLVAVFRFAKVADLQGVRAQGGVGTGDQSTKAGAAKWPSNFSRIRVDLHAGPDRQQDMDAKDKLLFALKDLNGVSAEIRDISGPKSEEMFATVQEWRGQASEVTKKEINAAFKYAGIQNVRWEKRPKLGDENPIPANQTQIQFTGPVGMRAAFDASWDPITFPSFANFNRSDGIRRTYLHLFPDKAAIAFPAAIDIYETDARVSAFLATNAVPIEVTDEDLQLMKDEKNITKLVYLLDHRDLEQSPLKLETLVVNSRTDADPDPFAEARRRGQIVAVFYVGPQAVLETEEKDPAAARIWQDLSFKGKPVTDPALVPAPFRGGLQITEINEAPRTSQTGDSLQKGDILIGAGIWETLSLNNILFAVGQQETQTDRNRPDGPKPLVLYLLRDGELVVSRQSVRSLDLPRTLGISPGSSMSLDQCIDLLQRKQVSNESLGVLEMMRRIVELANTAPPKQRHQVTLALFLKGETLDPISKTDAPLYNEIIQLLQKLPDVDLLPLQIEILQTGGPARTLLAVHSLKKLRDYTSRLEFPALVDQLWKLSGSDEHWLQFSILDIFADTLTLTHLKPEEFSTEERRKMVERLIEIVPRRKVIDLLSSALQSSHIDIAMRAAQVLTGQSEHQEPEILEKKLQLLINVLKGQVGDTKASRGQRAMALSQLRTLGSNAAPAVPALVALLERDDPDLKPVEPANMGRGGRMPEFTSDGIISTLGGIGPAASAALPELETRLKLAEQQEREEAILSPDLKTRSNLRSTCFVLRSAINLIKAVELER